MWAVTRDSLESCRLPPRSEIEAASRKVYELLTARQPKKDMTESEQEKRIAEADAKLRTETAGLSRVLLGPISAQLRQEWKGKRLAVVASGALEYLPLAVLPLPETERSGGTRRRGDGETGRRGEKEPLPPSPLTPSPRRLIPLIVSHEVVNLPSASALAIPCASEAAGRQGAPVKTLAALADPVFEANDPRPWRLQGKKLLQMA